MASCAGLPKWGFPKSGVPFLGVLIIRTIVFWGLYWGPLVLGNYQMSRVGLEEVLVIPDHIGVIGFEGEWRTRWTRTWKMKWRVGFYREDII